MFKSSAAPNLLIIGGLLVELVAITLLVVGFSLLVLEILDVPSSTDSEVVVSVRAPFSVVSINLAIAILSVDSLGETRLSLLLELSTNSK